MNYDEMTIKSLANDCFEKGGYKINRADLESRIQHLCDKYHQDKLDNLAQHLVIGCSLTKLELQQDIGDFKKGDIKTDAEWCKITKRRCSNLPLIGDWLFKINTL